MLKQLGALVFIGLRSVPQRLGSSSVIVIGIAGVVAVLVSVMAMAGGLRKAFVETGHADRAIVLRDGASAESVSTLSVEQAATIAGAPGVMRSADGRALASSELVVAANVRRRSSGSLTGVAVRGIGPEAWLIRPELQIVSGRAFTPGLRELVVGRAAQKQFKGLDIGSRVTLRDGEWLIVGVVASGGDLHESELFADVSTLMSASQRATFSAVTVKLDSAESFAAFKAALTSDPTLSVEVMSEHDYYEKQSQGASSLMHRAAILSGLLMALGAVLAAFNTMYSAVSTRSVEIATLRALGFSSGGAALSVLVEALALALVGALAGAFLAWLFFSGNTLSTVSGAFDSQIVFEIDIGRNVLPSGILVGILVGLVGGLLPAVRAARLPVSQALRATE
jgi:putative ABC transport system permease protein